MMAKKVNVAVYVEAADVADFLSWLNEYKKHVQPYEVQNIRNWKDEQTKAA